MARNNEIPSNASRLPNLVVIGSMKAGTTSLHFYLDQHPQISMSREKELNFFSENWAKGIDWYASQFNSGAKICGESSPSYTYYPIVTGVPERMHAIVPDAKLIYVVRDPIERIISHYIHYAQTGDPPSLSEELIDIDKCLYIHCSKYYMQLEQYLQFYPLPQILLITQEELLNHRQETMKQVFNFLDVDDSFHSPYFLQTRHRSHDKRRKGKIAKLLAHMFRAARLGQLSPEFAWHLERIISFPFSQPISKPSLDEKLRQEFVGYLKEDVEKLQRLVRREFDEWSL